MALLTIKGDTTFAIGDILRIKIGIEDEWMRVLDNSNAPTYEVERDLAGSYASNDNPTWGRGSTIVNYGQSGAGGLFMTSSEDYSPYLDILTHSGSPWSTISTKVRLGNLEGISDSLYGTLSGYGLYSDNVYLRGKLYAPDIKTAISGSRIELNSNGLIGYDGSNNEIFGMLLDSISGIGDVGDFIIGDINGDHLIWDSSEGELSFTGTGGGSDFISNIVFSTIDGNTASWASGSIVFSDGTIRNIVSGDTGNIISTTYIYFDSAISETILQTTNLFSDTVGKTKVFLARVELPESGQNQVIISSDKIKGTIISGNSIVTGSILAEKLNVMQLDAIAINTGSLTIDETINVGTGGKLILDGANKIIKVYDDSNNIRVEFGLLS